MDEVTWRYPEIHPKADGRLFIASTGNCYFLDFWWFEGAKIAYAAATAKGFLAYWVWRALPSGLAFSKLGYALLPSAGDWIYRDQDGRCSSLAMFIDCDLKRRAAIATAAGTDETRSGSAEGKGAGRLRHRQTPVDTATQPTREKSQ